jgi:phospholipase C
MIGQAGDQANHTYDLADFWKAAVYGTLPAVSFLKFSTPNTGHPADSSALAEQRYLGGYHQRAASATQWKNMAIMITYDDSDGFYDHVMPPIVSPSNDPANDSLVGPSLLCGTPGPSAYLATEGMERDCLSWWFRRSQKPNYVDLTPTYTTSILRFIEDNRNLGVWGTSRSRPSPGRS